MAPIFHLSYRQYTGFVISAAITRYVYITINQDFRPRIIVKDSKFEAVDCVEEIQHPIIREALKLTGVAGPYLEIVSLPDIPAGIGTGSSGSLTTAYAEAGLRAATRPRPSKPGTSK